MIRKANIISSLGHETIMKQVSKASNEMQPEAAFLGHCVAHSAKKMAYPQSWLLVALEPSCITKPMTVLLVESRAFWLMLALSGTTTAPVS